MCRIFASVASTVVLVSLLCPLAVGQSFVFEYDFDGRLDIDGDFDLDGDVDGADFLDWQLGAPPLPPFPGDLVDWETNFGMTTPGDRTDWMTSHNWGDGGFDPLFPLVPNFETRVEIEERKYGVFAPVIGPGDAAQAYGVRIGRDGGDGGISGEGLLTMTGGTLELDNRCSAAPFNCSSRLRVGNANTADADRRYPGTFNLSDGIVTTDTLWIGSGSHGEMNMSGGTVNTRGIFYMDWTGHPDNPLIPIDTESVLNMNGGTINVGTFLNNAALRMYRQSSLNLDGGEIVISGPAELGTQKQAPGSSNPPIDEIPNVNVSIMDGLLESGDFLQVRGSVVMSGGILRAESFNEADSTGTVEINGSGLLQFDNSQESVGDVEGLISSGFFTTSEATPLAVNIVDVSGTNFTQVSVSSGSFGADTVTVPEPSSVVLGLLVSSSMLFRRGSFFGKARC